MKSELVLYRDCPVNNSLYFIGKGLKAITYLL